MKLLRFFPFLAILFWGCEQQDNTDYTFESEKRFDTHREVEVKWNSEGAIQSGTLYLPRDSGFYPAAVWVHGSSNNLRKPYKYEYYEVVRHSSACTWINRGYAFFSYDKRGTGASEGKHEPYPDYEKHLRQLGRDALSALQVCAKHPEINPGQIGFFGESQAGWTIPTIISNEDEIAFNIIINGPAIKYGEFEFFAQMTGNNETQFMYTDCENINLDSIYNLMYKNRQNGTSYTGYDPYQDLVQMKTGTLFIQGLRDLHQPSRLSATDLNIISEEYNKDWQILTFENADHGLLTNNGVCLTKQDKTLIRELHFQVDWETPTFLWLAKKSGIN